MAVHEHDVLLVTADEGSAGLRRLARRSLCDAIVLMDIEAKDERVPVAASLPVPVILIGVPEDPAGLSCVDLDHRLVEFSATIPARTKFRGGALKKVLREATTGVLPASVLSRTDKMGFPVPLGSWLGSKTGDFVRAVFADAADAGRDEINFKVLVERSQSGVEYSRTLWGYLCLALWYEEFHDRASEYRALLDRDWALVNLGASASE